MEEILHHLISMKPHEKWDILEYQLLRRISYIKMGYFPTNLP